MVNTALIGSQERFSKISLLSWLRRFAHPFTAHVIVDNC